VDEQPYHLRFRFPWRERESKVHEGETEREREADRSRRRHCTRVLRRYLLRREALERCLRPHRMDDRRRHNLTLSYGKRGIDGEAALAAGGAGSRGSSPVYRSSRSQMIKWRPCSARVDAVADREGRPAWGLRIHTSEGDGPAADSGGTSKKRS